MRIDEARLAEVWDRGFAIVENFVDGDRLKAAQDALWDVYPRPEDYFAAQVDYATFKDDPFAGVRFFPYPSWAINRLAIDPDLIDAAERFLSSRDIEIYKVELWAKYAGAANYEQQHHRDYPSHSLVTPRSDQAHAQMTTFLLLSDVGDVDGPTRLVPQNLTRNIPMGVSRLPVGAFAAEEVAATAPAGSLLIYKTDVFHRGSSFAAPGRSRFVMMVDFQQRGWRWNGKMSWPDHAFKPAMAEALVRMSPRERDLFGWPPIGSDYWNAQTLADVTIRYPGIDLTPYAEPAGLRAD